ncbi:MAG: hypothetical protein EON60_11330 [Alphaproteobacteria bacterium]|nr:MAG: hypothetical protein EON60_11330 [Alphaproteobacteria bacterium]
MKALALTLALTCTPVLASAGSLPFDDVGFLPKKARPTQADDTFFKSPEGLSRIGYMVAEKQDEADEIAATEALNDLRQNLAQTSVFAMNTAPAATQK